MTPHLHGALPAPHGFFTREGGVSTGPFASLNCSLSGADDPAAVAENRRRVAAAIGVQTLVGCTQVHGAAVAVVDTPWPPGTGPRADAMVTRRPGLGLGIITADCAPVLFAAPGVVGAAHAGWRGALAGVLEAVVAAMGGQDVQAAVGPCIGPASYEVGADLRDAGAGAGGGGRAVLRRGAAGATGCSTCRATAPPGCAPRGRPSMCWGMTRWRTSSASSAIAAARLPGAARSAIRSR